MTRLIRLSALAFVAVLAVMLRPWESPVPAQPTPPAWFDDFESGGFDAWDDLNGNTSTLEAQNRYFALAADPVGGPETVFRATVDRDAVEPGEEGQRALLQQFPARVPAENKTGAFEGSEQWYHGRIYFPLNFVPAKRTDWNWVVIWHNWPDTVCCANLALTVDTDPGRGRGTRLSLRTLGGGSRRRPVDRGRPRSNPEVRSHYYVGDPSLNRGHWYDFVVHVKWSYRHDRGLVSWWLDGRLIVSRRMSTLYWYADSNSSEPKRQPGPGQAYLQVGYYRDRRLLSGARDTSTMSVYHDDYSRGPTRESVE